MKIQILLVFIVVISFKAMAQAVEVKRPWFSAGLQANTRLNGGNAGLSGTLEFFLPSNTGAIPSSFIGVVKGMHLQGEGGSFWGFFDDDITNNITSLSIMAGYRLGLTKPSYDSKRYGQYTTAGLFLEGLVGVGFNGPRTSSATFDINLGYQLTKSFDINISGQWMRHWDNAHSNLWIGGIGGAFSF